jgi:hypothetical protein
MFSCSFPYVQRSYTANTSGQCKGPAARLKSAAAPAAAGAAAAAAAAALTSLPPGPQLAAGVLHRVDGEVHLVRKRAGSVVQIALQQAAAGIVVY